MKMSSFQDKKGKWFIDCAECQLGGNGDASCASGWTIKKVKRGGCFIGTLLEKYQVKEAAQ